MYNSTDQGTPILIELKLAPCSSKTDTVSPLILKLKTLGFMGQKSYNGETIVERVFVIHRSSIVVRRSSTTQGRNYAAYISSLP